MNVRAVLESYIVPELNINFRRQSSRVREIDRMDLKLRKSLELRDLRTMGLWKI